jgi:hypothetical protein
MEDIILNQLAALTVTQEQQAGRELASASASCAVNTESKAAHAELTGVQADLEAQQKILDRK